MSDDRIRDIVAAVEAEHPAPEALADLDALTRGRIERGASALGVTPEAFWQAARAAADSGARSDAEAVSLAARIAEQ